MDKQNFLNAVEPHLGFQEQYDVLSSVEQAAASWPPEQVI
jgi:hypothetical protein